MCSHQAATSAAINATTRPHTVCDTACCAVPSCCAASISRWKRTRARTSIIHWTRRPVPAVNHSVETFPQHFPKQPRAALLLRLEVHRYAKLTFVRWHELGLTTLYLPKCSNEIKIYRQNVNTGNGSRQKFCTCKDAVLPKMLKKIITNNWLSFSYKTNMD